MTIDELYDADWIELYDKAIPEWHYRDSFGNLLHLINKYNPSAKRILDLACGTGRYTKYFVQKGFDVKGIDISSAAIRQAKKYVPSASFYVADTTKLRGGAGV